MLRHPITLIGLLIISTGASAWTGHVKADYTVGDSESFGQAKLVVKDRLRAEAANDAGVDLMGQEIYSDGHLKQVIKKIGVHKVTLSDYSQKLSTNSDGQVVIHAQASASIDDHEIEQVKALESKVASQQMQLDSMKDDNKKLQQQRDILNAELHGAIVRPMPPKKTPPDFVKEGKNVYQNLVNRLVHGPRDWYTVSIKDRVDCNSGSSKREKWCAGFPQKTPFTIVTVNIKWDFSNLPEFRKFYNFFGKLYDKRLKGDSKAEALFGPYHRAFLFGSHPAHFSYSNPFTIKRNVGALTSNRKTDVWGHATDWVVGAYHQNTGSSPDRLFLYDGHVYHLNDGRTGLFQDKSVVGIKAWAYPKLLPGIMTNLLPDPAYPLSYTPMPMEFFTFNPIQFRTIFQGSLTSTSGGRPESLPDYLQTPDEAILTGPNGQSRRRFTLMTVYASGSVNAQMDLTTDVSGQYVLRSSPVDTWYDDKGTHKIDPPFHPHEFKPYGQ